MATDEQRLWSKVAIGDGCWEWTGARTTSGTHRYGLVRMNGRQVRAHRAIWELLHGPIPAGKNLCHRCDNPPCVRPDHLFLGTQRENLEDMTRKGRRKWGATLGDQAGEANRYAKLTRERVAHIRGMADAGYYQDDIAARYGINRANVSYIVRRKTWADVEPIPYPPAVRDRPVGRPPKGGRR